MIRRLIQAAAIPAVVVAALTVLVTWPQALHIATRVAAHDDPLFSIWRLAWIAHALATDPAPLFDANIFHPATKTLTFSDAMLLEGALARALVLGRRLTHPRLQPAAPRGHRGVRSRDVRAGAPRSPGNGPGDRLGGDLHDGAVPRRALHASRAAVGDVGAADALVRPSNARNARLAVRTAHRSAFSGCRCCPRSTTASFSPSPSSLSSR